MQVLWWLTLPLSCVCLTFETNNEEKISGFGRGHETACWSFGVSVGQDCTNLYCQMNSERSGCFEKLEYTKYSIMGSRMPRNYRSIGEARTSNKLERKGEKTDFVFFLFCCSTGTRRTGRRQQRNRVLDSSYLLEERQRETAASLFFDLGGWVRVLHVHHNSMDSIFSHESLSVRRTSITQRERERQGERLHSTMKLMQRMKNPFIGEPKKEQQSLVRERQRDRENLELLWTREEIDYVPFHRFEIFSSWFDLVLGIFIFFDRENFKDIAEKCDMLTASWTGSDQEHWRLHQPPTEIEKQLWMAFQAVPLHFGPSSCWPSPSPSFWSWASSLFHFLAQVNTKLLCQYCQKFLVQAIQFNALDVDIFALRKSTLQVGYTTNVG